MSAPDVGSILRVPGRLSYGPTNTASLQTDYPHGGTALGLVGEVAIRPVDPVFVETAQEWGGAPVDLLEGGPRWVLDFKLRELEASALGAIFPCYAAGTFGGPVLKYVANGAVRPGFRVGTVVSVVLVFTPDSPDDYPMLLVRRAVPAVQETALLALRGNLGVSIPARFYATPDTNKAVFDYGVRRELVL